MAKVMLVDDHEDIVETLKMIMAKEGYDTAQASSGDEFINKVDKVKPDLVLLDVMMPGLTTKQVLERLKEKGLGKLKIILLTVVRFSDDEMEALTKDYKVVDYITKPFDVPDLVKRVKKYLG